MTEAELTALTSKLTDILHHLQLLSTTPPTLTQDPYQANQEITKFRSQLHHIDHELFECIRDIDKTCHYNALSPQHRRRYTVDDLDLEV